jgi:hypothetical protein
MKLRLIALLCLLSNAAFAADPATTPDAPDAAAKKKVIEQGMTGDEIAQLFGRPVEIKPMKMDDPAAKAEQWIYRRKLKETTSSSAIAPNAMPTVSLSDANNAAYQIHVPVAQYRIQRITTYQLTALLMVNGRLAAAKQWTERTEDYD